MSVPVLTFFNNKGGVGKTSLVYHLAWMLAEEGERVLVCDLDPQANLTASFLDEEELELLWDDSRDNRTIYQCIAPVTEMGDLKKPHVRRNITNNNNIGLIPGDLALSGFEDTLSEVWPKALETSQLKRPFRILTAFWQIIQMGASTTNASVILIDVGPNLGALNRSALIATDHVIAPLGADLFSLHGLRNLGPTLRDWREQWQQRRRNWERWVERQTSHDAPLFTIPKGRMQPVGYVVHQHSVRLKRPVKAYDKWVNRMPEAYAKYLMQRQKGSFANTPQDDSDCLATLKHYRSLVPMAQEARKPIFALTNADGAIGNHAAAVRDAYDDFRNLARSILGRIGPPSA